MAFLFSLRVEHRPGPVGLAVVFYLQSIPADQYLSRSHKAIKRLTITPEQAGICGIRAGLRFVREKGRERIYAHEIALLQRVYDRLASHPGIRVYTPRPAVGRTAPVLSLNVVGLPSEQTAALLNEQGIAVRAGLHCAPLAHTRFGTLPQGTVRLAPSAFSTAEEAEKIGKVFSQIAKKSLHSEKIMV